MNSLSTTFFHRSLVEKLPQPGEQTDLFDLALPHRRDLPAVGAQRGWVLDVTLFIARNLRLPVFGVGLGLPVPTGAAVIVQEAAVNEDDFAPGRKNEIWLARQILDMQAISIPGRVQPAADDPLGLRILAFDRPHRARSRGLGPPDRRASSGR